MLYHYLKYYTHILFLYKSSTRYLDYKYFTFMNICSNSYEYSCSSTTSLSPVLFTTELENILFGKGPKARHANFFTMIMVVYANQRQTLLGHGSQSPLQCRSLTFMYGDCICKNKWQLRSHAGLFTMIPSFRQWYNWNTFGLIC